MRILRLTRASLIASAALLPLPIFAAHAVERNLFTWSGTIDREVIIEVRGRDVYTRGAGTDASTSPRLNIAQALPRISGVVHVRLDNGRGDVEVLENPNSRNNYTARVRVRDPRAGTDQYRLVVTFDADNTYGNNTNGNNDGVHGRSNDNADQNNGSGYGRGDDNSGQNNGRGYGRDKDKPKQNNGRGNGRNNGSVNSRGNDRNDDRDNNRNNDRNNNGGINNGGTNNGTYGNGSNNNADIEYDRNRTDAGALRWSGVVDGVADVRIQGRQVIMSSQGQQASNVQYDVFGAALPRRDARLELSRSSGRGTVRVVQQPSAWNGYVAIIRIEDAAAGAAAYNFDVRW